ncbi:hypothetical protein UVI_02017670 [Ustilaginoidea virens]|uniref:Multidrug resistance protein 1 n=1 Tax=Ustilaginoidea virens TaxID=1159556 RepID=A0A1B5KT65_USTVR|nr:hypothetical protein UVI_02017670 [Ustilaginoidea virens]
MAAIRTVKTLRVDFVRQLLRQEVAFFDTSLSVAGQITTNGNVIYHGISEKLGLIVQSLSMLVSAFAVALTAQWKLALITLAIIPANTIVILVCVYFDTKYEYGMLDIYGVSDSLAEEALSTIRTAHAFWAFPKLVARFDELLRSARRVGDKKSVLYAVLFPVEFFTNTAGYGLAFWQGMRIVIFAALVAAQALTQIAPHVMAVSKAMAAAQELFSTIDRESAVDSLSRRGVDIPDFRGSIRLRGVCFSYPSRPDVPVLRQLDLDFAPGKTTAIVGASGSGKSTIFGLLERWYSRSAGEITLDGHRLEDINLRWLRTNIRLIQQEPTLFSGTIYQNVMDGLSGSDARLSEQEKRARVAEACRAALIHDFVEDLPRGYDTWIGERGASLSGGQKQRLVIARTIISNPRVLLLDEATSALDPGAERKVQEALASIARGRTVVTIAHRLSTIRGSDSIVLLKGGQVAESGTHAELVGLGGFYARLVRAQDLGEKHSGDDGDASGHAEDAGAAEKEPKQVLAGSSDEVATEAAPRYGLLRGLFLVMKEQRVLWRPAFVIVACCTTGGVTYPAMAVLISKSLEAYNTTDVAKANFFALMFLVLSVGNLVLYAVTGWLSNVIAQTVMEFYRGDIFNNTLRQDMAFFDRPDNSTGALVSRLASEASSLQELLSINLALVLICMVNLLSSCVLAIAYGWKLGLVLACGALPFIVGSGYLRIRLESKFEQDTVQRFASSSAVAAEAVMGIRTISSLALESTVVERYSQSLGDIAYHAVGNLGYKMLFYALSQSVSMLAMGLGFWYGAKLVSTGEYTSSRFYIVYLAIVFSGEAAAIMFQYTTSISKAGTAINYVFGLRHTRILFDDDDDQDEEPDAPAEKVLDEKKSSGLRLSLDNVHFAYPLRREQRVLRGIDMHVRPGKMVAFVGASGCGKSTLVGLLERFYDPTSGALRVDGQDIRRLHRRRYRREMALVEQEPVLYQASIRDNISLGVEQGDPSEAQTIEACRSANAWDFISSLPDGLETLCGARGFALSGGQRQRIAIARALVRKPRLLLLDEATSALDTESERVVKAALDRAAEGRTTVAVAHRLSTIRDADAIVVFFRGRIVESGSHDELLRRRGVYYEMVLGQSLDGGG